MPSKRAYKNARELARRTIRNLRILQGKPLQRTNGTPGKRYYVATPVPMDAEERAIYEEVRQQYLKGCHGHTSTEEAGAPGAEGGA